MFVKKGKVCYNNTRAPVIRLWGAFGDFSASFAVPLMQQTAFFLYTHFLQRISPGIGGILQTTS